MKNRIGSYKMKNGIEIYKKSKYKFDLNNDTVLIEVEFSRLCKKREIFLNLKSIKETLEKDLIRNDLKIKVVPNCI